MSLENKFFKKSKRTVAAIALALSLFGCKHSVTTTSEETETKPQLSENVVVLSEDSLAQISSVEDYTGNINLSGTTFEIDSLKPGTIIISGITDSTPQGLLRRVTGHYNKNVITTIDVSLDQVVDNYSFSSTQKLTPKNLSSVSLAKGISPRTSFDAFDFNYDFKNVVLYDPDDTEDNGNEIIANGTVSFNSQFDLDFEIKDFEIQTFTFKNTNQDEVYLEVSAPTNFKDLKQSYVLNWWRFSPFLLTTIPTTPPIPIIITPYIELNLDLEGKSSSEISASLSQQAELTFGLSYSEGSWKPIKKFSNYLLAQRPYFPDEVELKIIPNQKLVLWLYTSLAGIYGKVYEYGKFTSTKNSNKWKFGIYGGLIGEAGIDMGIFSHIIPDYNATLFEYEEPFYEAESDIPQTPNTVPFANFLVSPTSGNVNANFYFDASSSKDDEDEFNDLLFRWDWNDEESSADDNIYDTDYSSNPIACHSYSSVGKYDVRLEVKDSGGLTSYVVKFNVVTVK